MDKNFIIDQNMINYIFSHTNNLHKVQKKLLKYNEKLGHIKKLQISILQANFIQFIIKINNYKSYLEIGTFTGYSILSAALALPKNCKLIGIDKNLKTNNEAIKFFKEAKQDKKINLLCENGKIALENLIKKKEKYDVILIDADKENYINYYEKIFYHGMCIDPCYECFRKQLRNQDRRIRHDEIRCCRDHSRYIM